MRLPHLATFRVIRKAPISDDAPETAIYDMDREIPCNANTASSTFDPNVTFDADTLQSGAFGDLIDIWVSSRSHKALFKWISDSGTPFSAKAMLRLVALFQPTINGKSPITLVENPVLSDLPSQEVIPGYPLSSMRVFPTMTVFTFDTQRVGPSV